MAGVNMPPARDTSLTSTLLKGLQAASAVMGIRKDMAQTDALQTEQDRKAEADAAAVAETDRKRRGELTPTEAAEHAAKGNLYEDAGPGRQQVTIGPPGAGKPAFIGAPKEKNAIRAPIAADGIVLPGKKTPQRAYLDPSDPTQVLASYDMPPKEKEDKSATTSAELRKEYTNHPTTKNTEAVISNVSKIDKIVANPNPTGASDIALVYSFMRAQDPNSSVREGEYATAENSGGVPASLAKMYNKLLDGQRLTPEVRQNFALESRRLLDAALENQAAVDDQYTKIAKHPSMNIDPSLVINQNFGAARQRMRDPAYTSGPKAKPNAGEAQASEAPAFDPEKKYPVGTIRQHEGTSELEQLNAQGQWAPYKAPTTGAKGR